MPTEGDETARLRDLHDDYVWELNAAIAEGREDLIAGLVDGYLADTVQQMAHDRLPGKEPSKEPGPGHGGGHVRLHASSATHRNHWWRRHRQ